MSTEDLEVLGAEQLEQTKNIITEEIYSEPCQEILNQNLDKEQLDKWTAGGFEKLRYEYDLNSESICFDLGAYYCEWSIKISDMYSNPTIYALEPIQHVYNVALEKTKNHNNIKLLNYGAGKRDEELDIVIGPAAGVSSSFFIEEVNPNTVSEARNETSFALIKTIGAKVKVNIKSIKNILEELDIQKIDLMKLNIEGSEYDVLECLLENNLHTKVDNIQVQFHRLSENYHERYLAIKSKLSATHKLTYEFPFIWENWKLR